MLAIAGRRYCATLANAKVAGIAATLVEGAPLEWLAGLAVAFATS